MLPNGMKEQYFLSAPMVLKNGEHMNRTGTVVGTHNGYYQVEVDGGRGWLNCRLKELCNLADRQRLVAPPRSRAACPSRTSSLR